VVNSYRSFGGRECRPKNSEIHLHNIQVHATGDSSCLNGLFESKTGSKLLLTYELSKGMLPDTLHLFTSLSFPFAE